MTLIAIWTTIHRLTYHPIRLIFENPIRAVSTRRLTSRRLTNNYQLGPIPNSQLHKKLHWKRISGHRTRTPHVTAPHLTPSSTVRAVARQATYVRSASSATCIPQGCARVSPRAPCRRSGCRMCQSRVGRMAAARALVFAGYLHSGDPKFTNTRI